MTAAVESHRSVPRAGPASAPRVQRVASPGRRLAAVTCTERGGLRCAWTEKKSVQGESAGNRYPLAQVVQATVCTLCYNSTQTLELRMTSCRPGLPWLPRSTAEKARKDHRQGRKKSARGAGAVPLPRALVCAPGRSGRALLDARQRCFRLAQEHVLIPVRSQAESVSFCCCSRLHRTSFVQLSGLSAG